MQEVFLIRKNTQTWPRYLKVTLTKPKNRITKLPERVKQDTKLQKACRAQTVSPKAINTEKHIQRFLSTRSAPRLLELVPFDERRITGGSLQPSQSLINAL